MYPVFPQISPHNWEHPVDVSVNRMIAPFQVMDVPLKMTIGRLNEFVIRELRLRERTAVTPEDCPRIHHIYTGVLNTFDVSEPWPLFVAPMGGINAFAAGTRAPFLVISREALALDDALLRVILAHEVAHLMSNHALRWTKVGLLMSQLSRLGIPAAASLPGMLGVGLPSSLVLMLAMRELLRRGEYTADRASTVAMGGAKDVVRMLDHVGRLQEQALNNRVDAARAQMTPEERELARARLARWVHFSDPHPTIAQRIRAVEDWAAHPSFAAILNGEYHRRGEPLPEGSTSDFRDHVRWGVKRISNMGERLSAGWPLR